MWCDVMVLGLEMLRAWKDRGLVSLGCFGCQCVLQVVHCAHMLASAACGGGTATLPHDCWLWCAVQPTKREAGRIRWC